jgi:hypothetical protein
VTIPPDQILRAVIAERSNCGRVCEADEPFGIDHPNRLRDSPQHSTEKVLGTDPQATENGH